MAKGFYMDWLGKMLALDRPYLLQFSLSEFCAIQIYNLKIVRLFECATNDLRVA